MVTKIRVAIQKKVIIIAHTRTERVKNLKTISVCTWVLPIISQKNPFQF